MRVAIVGAGVSGLVAASLLRRSHDVVVFESAAYAGGHVNTIDVVRGGVSWPVDTGFIAYNPENYPGFSRLLDRLGVATKPTRMTFGLRDEATGLEYAAGGLAALFAQRGRALSLAHWRFVRDLWRFSRTASKILDRPERAHEPALGEWLAAEGYGAALVERFVVPIAAAIWSTSPAQVRAFPARFFVRFLTNHRMLARRGQPVWRVVIGGSREYVRRLVEPFRASVRLSTPVESIRREADHVLVRPRGGAPEKFDEVVLAVHSDVALRLLADPSPEERAILAAIPYQKNDAVLHTDARLLPREARARACWNYHLHREEERPVAVTYDMNRLQGLAAPDPFCVTLNRAGAVDPGKVVAEIPYEHPLFTIAGVGAQRRFDEISGTRRTHYAGAYWGYGFHEDGVQSALRVARRFGEGLA